MSNKKNDIKCKHSITKYIESNKILNHGNSLLQQCTNCKMLRHVFKGKYNSYSKWFNYK